LGEPATAGSGPGVYRPRRPEQTTFYRLLDEHFEEYQAIYEERFEVHDGPWRSCVDRAVQAFLDCGRLYGGFARLRCPSCKTEHLLAFSCQTRNFCASCQAKRAALFAERLRHEVLAEVPHRHLIFTIPKALRGLFRRERRLLGLLSRTAYDVIRRLYQAHFDCSEVLPGCVASLQTFGSYSANFHPHAHLLVTDGVFTPEREFLPLLSVDVNAIERLFQALLLRRLHAAQRLSEIFIERLETWRHPGFSVYGEQVVMPNEPDRLERLARYLTRPPLPVASVSQHHDGRVCVKTPPDPNTGATDLLLDPIDWVHRVCSQIPDPRLHLTRFYGAYANKVRRLRLPARDNPAPVPAEDEDTDFVKARKASWARLIRRLYEVDPLLCPRCGTLMEILAVITDPPVIDRILRHLHDASIPDPFAGARAPPATEARPSIGATDNV
jgi:transposase